MKQVLCGWVDHIATNVSVLIIDDKTRQICRENASRCSLCLEQNPRPRASPDAMQIAHLLRQIESKPVLRHC